MLRGMIIIFHPNDARPARAAAHRSQNPTSYTPGRTPERPQLVPMDEEEAVFTDPFGPLETSGR